MKILSVILTLCFVQTSHATVIAVIDSGTDLNHKQLVDKKWVNPKDVDDAVDNDDNGLIDDVNGWNFAENNNKLLDKKYLGTFSSDVYKFFEVQTRLLKGEATEEDRAWYMSMRDNAQFISELQTFGNFVHGTHVAGIVARNADQAKVMPIKIIPTKSPIGGGGHLELFKFGDVDANMDKVLRMGLKLLASQQSKALAPIGKYIALEKARVANCSFGTSTAAVKSLIEPLLKAVIKREPTEEEVTTYSAFFVGEVVKAAGALIDPAKDKTLFVIAAGNDGADNDVLPTSPANYKTNNTIAVAATLGYKKLASFSSFGATKVEVAAPGVGIESSIPGDQTLTVSGTSQASPFVANVVGLMLDENPNLSNSDIKAVLMGTVDLKDFLKGKVSSSGIVNLNRAVFAAKMAKSMQLSEAIDSSRLQVSDVSSSDKMNDVTEEGFVIPLPSFIR